MEIASEALKITAATIYGIDEPCIDAYFDCLSHGKFRAAAALFATHGYLQPPFDHMIRGKETIAVYLAKETKGMRFRPESGKKLATHDEYTQFDIRGRVETDFFAFNVRWLVQLNLKKEIIAMEVKLLDSLSSLLPFNHAFQREF
jgi:hypothetical protein